MATVPAAALPADMEAFYKMAKYPLIAHSDMSDEMRGDAVEICTTACEKFLDADLEKCTQVRTQQPAASGTMEAGKLWT